MRAAFLILALFAVYAIAGPQPTFPNDWSALEDDEMMIFQGDVSQVGTKMCCDSRSNCQVQTEFQLGMTYVDVTNQRSRFDDRISGQVIVTNYALQKNMLINKTDLSCMEYCPLQGESLTPGFLDVNATDLGPEVLPDGRKANHWQWKDTILGVIVMDVIDVYVNQTDMKNAVPLGQAEHLTPFGQHIGDFYANWNQFQPGTPDPKLFDVQGVDSCPKSQNCGQSSYQMNRLRFRQMKSYIHYQQEANLAASGVVRVALEDY
jgi:hypothetical protein